MKLFSRYNRLNTAATIVIFLIGSIFFFLLCQYILINQVDESLETEQREIEVYVNEYHKLPKAISTKEQLIHFSETTGPAHATYKTIKDFHKGTKVVPGRMILFTVNASEKWYLATVAEPIDQTKKLQRMIIAITLAMVALMLAAVYYINRIVLKNLWQPFYKTIKNVDKYSLASNLPLQLPETEIDEFRILHHSLREMTGKAAQDYESLKEFTALAAHEMQTPLAVIRNKTDHLLQQEGLLARHFRELTDIEKSVQKLSRLHHSLLLLTKVENRQFVLDEPVQIDELIREKCDELSDLLEAGALKIKLDLAPLSITYNHHLSEILIGNLLNNAIRYNTKEGQITIQLKDRKLTIANNSYLPELNKELLYQHFYRHPDTKSDGNGLGLPIVKQICATAGFTISYQYENGFHSFSILFCQILFNDFWGCKLPVARMCFVGKAE